MAILGVLTIASIVIMVFMGLAWTHITIISFFIATIFFGALVIADLDDEKKDNMYNDFGRPAKDK